MFCSSAWSHGVLYMHRGSHFSIWKWIRANTWSTAALSDTLVGPLNAQSMPFCFCPKNANIQSSHTQTLGHSILKCRFSIHFHSFPLELQIIHEGSQHPQKVKFPLLQLYTSKLIHHPQYSESPNNKGVTLQLKHSITHKHMHTHAQNVMERLISFDNVYDDTKQK